MAKGKVISGTPVVSRKFKNSAGFDAGDRKIGGDTVPGPMVGAPLYNSRKVDDYDAKSERFWVGNAAPTPGGLNEVLEPVVGATPNGSQSAQLDAPTPAGRQMPHPDLVNKAQEAASSDAAIGDTPHPAGVLGRE